MLPERFIHILHELRLDDAAEALANTTPQVSVRLNRDKSRPELADMPGVEPVPWCGRGLYLPERPSFTLDPQWHQGLYYVQEAGSMFHGYVARQLIGDSHQPLQVLDACAAPGGKTTAVIDALPEGSVMVANEYVPARAAILKDNLTRRGYPGVIVTRGDTSRLTRLRAAFDIVIADVPCSGEGMMRKDAEAVAQWSEGLVEECAALQREIVSNLWPTLRPNGTLIYSTCTFNRRENEENVEWICRTLGGHTVEIPVDPAWGITPALRADGSADTELHCYRFIPGRTRSEGLFVAVIAKDSDGSEEAPHQGADTSTTPALEKPRKGSRDKQRHGKGASTAAALLDRLPQPEPDFEIIAEADRLTAFPRAHRRLLERIKGCVDVIAEGVQMATVKGSTLIPAHPLALSTRPGTTGYPTCEIDRATAIDYLRGNSPVLPTEVPTGYVVLTYLGEPLGFVKNLGRRTNSLYPRKINI